MALKGTDGGVVDEAVRRGGARPIAQDLVRLFLNELSHYKEAKEIEFLTGGPGPLGENILREFEFDFDVIRHRKIGYREVEGVRLPDTTPEDTKELAKRMAKAVELIIFAGGDGTARDILEAVEERVPVLGGVPTGVKMYSGVFAYSPPEDAARVLIEFLKGNARLEEREVRDIDEEAYRRDEVRAKTYGTAIVPPVVEALVQGGSKERVPPIDEEEELETISGALAEEILENDGIYFLGSGSTVKRIKDRLGIDGTLLGSML